MSPMDSSRLRHRAAGAESLVIDAVITWVDGADARWRAEFEAWNRSSQPDVGLDGRDACRYRDNGELRFALRAIARYAPWFRRVHVVTQGHRPRWLEPVTPICLVDHAEILDGDHLPTFNSHAIESRLHRIRGLAEHFVYFNDDVFLARPQRPSSYFTADGRPIVAFDKAPLPDVDGSTGATVDLGALVALALLRRHGVSNVRSQRPGHGPFALRRSVLLELERLFPDELAETARHRFRGARDVPLPTFLAPVYGVATGAAIAGDLGVGYAGLDDEDLVDQLAMFASEELDAFCLNDTERVASGSAAFAVAQAFLARRYPTAAVWERDREQVPEPTTGHQAWGPAAKGGR